MATKQTSAAAQREAQAAKELQAQREAQVKREAAAEKAAQAPRVPEAPEKVRSNELNALASQVQALRDELGQGIQRVLNALEQRPKA